MPQSSSPSSPVGNDVRSAERLFALSPDPLCVVGPEGRLERVSPAFERALGWTAEELRGRPLLDLVHPDDRAAVAAVLREPTAPDDEGVEIRSVHRDGSVRRLHWRLSPPDEAGRVYGVARDVTGRREREARRCADERLAAVGRLAGGVARGFSDVLMVVQNYGAYVAAELPADASLQADMDAVLRAAGRGTELTRQLLAFGRQLLLQPRLVDLSRIVASAVEPLGRLVGEGIAIETDLATDAWPVLADPGQLQRALTILAANARDAMPEGGTLRLRTANVVIDAATARARPGLAPGEHASLVVEDTGRGVEPALLPRLFEPFFTTKDPGSGVGLGLAAVHGIVGQSGGHVGVDSAIGRGSRFTILLPRAAVDAPGALGATTASASAARRETVLLVEDDSSVRDAVRIMLERQGYTVLAAASAEQAMQIGEATDGRGIDVMLTDIVMPHETGAALAARLAARWPGLRVLFMSGFTDDELTRQGFELSGSAFLEKPFSPEQLERALRRLLDGVRPSRAR